MNATEAAQARTIDTATRRGEIWTQADLDLIHSSPLKAEELARLLGRTAYAVYTARKKRSASDTVRDPGYGRETGSRGVWAQGFTGLGDWPGEW
jgi:hypothetical protein